MENPLPVLAYAGTEGWASYQSRNQWDEENRCWLCDLIPGTDT